MVIENLTPEPQEVEVALAYACDFADVLEAQSGGNGAGRMWIETRPRSLTLWYERQGYRRGTVLSFNRQGRVTEDSATFRVSLGPRESWSLCVDITTIIDGRRNPPLLRCDSFGAPAPKMPMSLDEWMDDAPNTSTGHRELERTYQRSLRVRTLER